MRETCFHPQCPDLNAAFSPAKLHLPPP
jgi:hypothetical protein